MSAIVATLFAALLVAQALPQPPGSDEPHRVAIVARKPDSANERGFFARLGDKASAAVRRLYQKEEPHAAEGNALAARSEAQGALDEYEKSVVPDESTAEGALAFDRSAALLKLGAEAAPRAVQEANRALDKGDARLKSQAAYQLGLGFEQLGKTEEAMAAYAHSLALDPEDEDAKVNLELLLRSQQEKKQPQQSQDGEKKEKKDPQKSSETKDDQTQKGGKDSQQEKQPDEQGEKKKDEKQSAGKSEGEEKKEEAQKQESQQEKPGDEKKEQAKEQQAQAQPLDRSEAQRLLDALRAGEKNLQVWRFAQKKTKEGRRPDAEKDW